MLKADEVYDIMERDYPEKFKVWLDLHVSQDSFKLSSLPYCAFLRLRFASGLT